MSSNVFPYYAASFRNSPKLLHLLFVSQLSFALFLKSAFTYHQLLKLFGTKFVSIVYSYFWLRKQPNKS